MSNLHIYSAPMQQATRFKDATGARTFWIKNPGNRLLWASCCGKKRPAKNLMVQVYYDKCDYFCKSRKGCMKGK